MEQAKNIDTFESYHSFMLSSDAPNDEFHDAEGDDENDACNDVLFDKVNKIMSTLKGKKLKMSS